MCEPPFLFLLFVEKLFEGLNYNLRNCSIVIQRRLFHLFHQRFRNPPSRFNHFFLLIHKYGIWIGEYNACRIDGYTATNVEDLLTLAKEKLEQIKPDYTYSNITLDQFANHLTNMTLNQEQINEVEAERDLIFKPMPDESEPLDTSKIYLYK